MVLLFVDFATLLTASLLVGAMFGVWLIFNPVGLGANAYVALQQQGIRTLNVAMPVLGAVAALLTVASAALGSENRTRFLLLLSAVICFVAAGLITRLLNQPINAIVITWPVDAPPSNWTQFRDAWWRWHLMRLVAGLSGLSLLIAGMLRRG
jgi:uncharacterized membrane protein